MTVNLESVPCRCGDQSGPNNHGVALARGRYIAFLNHDDLFLPQHLGACVETLETSGADFVWTAMANMLPRDDFSREGMPCGFELRGAPSAKGWSPFPVYIASSWMFRRGLAARAGPWDSGASAYWYPSQMWLFRVWRSGADMRFLPRVTAIKAPSLPGSYAKRESPEHEALSAWIKSEPLYFQRILEETSVRAAINVETLSNFPRAGKTLKRVLLGPVYALLMRLGVHPMALPVALLFRRRGEMIALHRRKTGA